MSFLRSALDGALGTKVILSMKEDVTLRMLGTLQEAARGKDYYFLSCQQPDTFANVVFHVSQVCCLTETMNGGLKINIGSHCSSH